MDDRRITSILGVRDGRIHRQPIIGRQMLVVVLVAVVETDVAELEVL
jgi:hypothetical protein